MILNEIINALGSFLVGFVFGWILVHTAWETTWDWKAYLAVLGAVVGGAGVDYLFKTNYVGYFWIGIFFGFLVDVLIRARKGQPYTMRAPSTP
jgi:fluoride ion exporter CrcB/FEX